MFECHLPNEGFKLLPRGQISKRQLLVASGELNLIIVQPHHCMYHDLTCPSLYMISCRLAACLQALMLLLLQFIFLPAYT